MSDITVEIALYLGAQHPEGPLWDGATGQLWWVDITRQRVHCFDPESGDEHSWVLPGQPGGVVLDAAGEPVVATPEGLAALDRKTGALRLTVPIEPDKPENRANDAKVDAHGRVWVGTMALDKRPGNGALYRVDGNKATCVVDGLTISNGPAFDEAAERLYLADSGIGVVYAFDFVPETGELGNRRGFLDFSAEGVWPDGMTVDDEGMLWVALGRAGAVRRFNRDGELRGVVALPTSNPTSVAFGGRDAGDLYITTSWFDLAPADRALQRTAGAIFRCRPGVTGRPTPRYLAPRADLASFTSRVAEGESRPHEGEHP